jgi:hypothetical protein
MKTVFLSDDVRLELLEKGKGVKQFLRDAFQETHGAIVEDPPKGLKEEYDYKREGWTFTLEEV